MQTAHHDRQQIRQSAVPFSQNRPFSATFVQWVCALAATPPRTAAAPPPTGANCAIQASDTPATRRKKASHGAKPPSQPSKVRRIAYKTWPQHRLARKNSPSAAPPPAFPRKTRPASVKTPNLGHFERAGRTFSRSRPPSDQQGEEYRESGATTR